MVGMQADAIVEAKLKLSDVSCALVVCSLIHQRYTEFSALLLDSWQKVLLTKKDDKVSTTQRPLSVSIHPLSISLSLSLCSLHVAPHSVLSLSDYV